MIAQGSGAKGIVESQSRVTAAFAERNRCNPSFR